jgi:predicted ABC-type ATPase
MKTYTIIAGVNGVGKSSLSGVLKDERSDLGFIIDIDKLGAENNLGALEAGKMAAKKIDDFLAKGITFTQETTLSGQKTEKTIKIAKDKGYFVRLFYVGLNTCEESVVRIKNRVEKGGHNIREEDVNRRFSNRFESLSKILPFCNEAVFYDNENGFVPVGGYKNGEFTTKNGYKPEWFQELLGT